VDTVADERGNARAQRPAGIRRKPAARTWRGAPEALDEDWAAHHAPGLPQETLKAADRATAQLTCGTPRTTTTTTAPRSIAKAHTRIARRPPRRTEERGQTSKPRLNRPPHGEDLDSTVPRVHYTAAMSMGTLVAYTLTGDCEERVQAGMRSGDVETLYQDGFWKNKIVGTDRVLSTHQTQRAAVLAGLQMAVWREVEHIIRNADGTTTERSYYGRLPRSRQNDADEHVPNGTGT